MLVPLEDARRRIDRARFPPPRIERVTVARAVGRLAAARLLAPANLPPGPVSAMDGYAVHLAGKAGAGPFHVRESQAGPWAPARSYGALRSGEAVSIVTGQALPPGANSVVRVESTRRAGDLLHVRQPARVGQDILRSGESIGRGDVLLERGQPIAPVHVGALLAQGFRDVPTFRIRATVVPVGDELVRAGARDRSRTPEFLGPVVAGLLGFADVTLLGPVPDDRDELAALLDRVARQSDLLLTIGGSSAGSHDVTKAAVRQVGDLLFEGVTTNVLKRGAVGRVAGTPTVVLPGQLVSCVTVFHEHALHVVSRWTRRELRRFETVRLGVGIHVRHRMDTVYLFAVPDGRAEPLPWGVARATALLRAEAFGVLTHHRTYRAGETVRLLRLWTLAA